MAKGRKPSQPPCANCGKPPICYQSPYYRCGCGRFRLKDGQLRPVGVPGRPASKPGKPKRATAKKERRGSVTQFQKPMTWKEFEELQN
jgi:hypothetical protein